MASEERKWLLISRAVSGEISHQDQEELEGIFRDERELRSDYENLKRLRLIPPGTLSTEERRAMERGLEKFDDSLSEERGFLSDNIFNSRQLQAMGHKSYKIWMVAASVFIALMASVCIFYHFKTSTHQLPQTELVTHYGKRVHTILPDGSVVWLNSGSSIKYDEKLIVNGKREIVLNGEAFFDVKHDAKHPFIVHAGKLNIVVLGTAFNVKAYSTDAFMETTLIRGKVEILNEARPGANIVLYPNEKVTVNTSQYAVKKIKLTVKRPARDSVALVPERTALLPQLPDEAIDETAWVSNKLTFKKEEFTALATQLERWYDVKITFDNNIYLSKQFTGTFKNQDINDVMRALQFTQPFHYAITNNQIHIW